MENVRCTKREIQAAQNGKYTLDKTENIRCTKRKICAAQKRKWVSHFKGGGRLGKIALGRWMLEKSLREVEDFHS